MASQLGGPASWALFEQASAGQCPAGGAQPFRPGYEARRRPCAVSVVPAVGLAAGGVCWAQSRLQRHCAWVGSFQLRACAGAGAGRCSATAGLVRKAEAQGGLCQLKAGSSAGIGCGWAGLLPCCESRGP